MAKDSSKKKKAEESGEPGRIRRIVARVAGAPATIAIFWPVALFCVSFIAWHQWGADRVATRFYGIDRSLVRLNEPPEYVREDVVASVYRDSALDQISLLDPQATAKIASAFAIHPWVRRVISVRKLTGGAVDVLVEFRRPVAMVIHRDDPTFRFSAASEELSGGRGLGDIRPEVSSPDASGGSGVLFLPVDREGIVLPTDDFARAETRNYIHIDVPGVNTAQKFVGLAYGDRRVEAASRLAGILADFRETAQVKTISVRGGLRGQSMPQLEITTFDGKRLFWGSPPGAEVDGEATAEMKLRGLLKGPGHDADLRVVRAATTSD